MQNKLNETTGIENKQMAGGYVSPEWVVNPELAEPYLKQCAEAGFFAYILFVRHMKQTVMDERVRDAVGKIVEIAHRHGVKLLLDTDPTWWASDLIELYPEAALGRIIPVDARAHKGHIRTGVTKPVNGRIMQFREISALYAESGEWRPARIAAQSVSGGVASSEGGPNIQHRTSNAQRPTSNIQEGEAYGWERIESGDFTCEWQGCRPGGHSGAGLTLDIRLNEAYTGPVRVYVMVSISNLMDHAHPRYLEMQKTILDRYADIPLDGVTWDEPGKGHDSLKEFRAGEGLLELFRKTNGYDLRDKLIYLDQCDGTAEAVRVRCDYFRALSDMNYNCQYEHNEHAKKLWGDDIIRGTHQTFSGLPLDLACGVMDHFRLGKVLTGAWTDGGINFERKILVFPLMLADSIKKELKQRDAYYNDWATEPHIEPMRFFNRLKTLYHVNTFAHIYSDALEYHVNMRLPDFAEPFEADVPLQDGLDALIGERLGDTDVAVWYGWEGYAALPKWGARVVYTFFQNISLLLTDTGLHGDFISNEGLEAAHVEGDRLMINDRPYKVVILPYAHALPKGVYETVMAAAEQGVKVVFVGPPPEFGLIENSSLGQDQQDLQDDRAARDESLPHPVDPVDPVKYSSLKLGFCEAVGVEPVSFADFEDAMAAAGVHIDPDGWEPTWLDVICPVAPTTAEATRNIEQAITVVKAADKELYWMPSLDPRDDLTDLIAPWCESKVEVFSRNAYHRTFSDPQSPDDVVLVLAPREGMAGWGLMPDGGASNAVAMRPPVKPVNLDALIKIGDKELRVTGEQWCVLHIRDGEVVEYLADDGVRIE